MQACTDPIVAANGEELLIRGKFNVTLQVGGIREEYPVYVASDVTPDCLLGADFLNHFGCIVDLAKRTLVAGGKCVSLKLNNRSHSSCRTLVAGGKCVSLKLNNRSHSSCHVSFLETMVIPPKHQVRAPVHLLSKCHSSELNYNALIEPSSNFFENTGLLVAHSVSSIHYAKTTVLILNPSLSPITVSKNENLGMAQPIDVKGVHVRTVITFQSKAKLSTHHSKDDFETT